MVIENGGTRIFHSHILYKYFRKKTAFVMFILQNCVLLHRDSRLLPMFNATT